MKWGEGWIDKEGSSKKLANELTEFSQKKKSKWLKNT
jgi:hypothetical protein